MVLSPTPVPPTVCCATQGNLATRIMARVLMGLARTWRAMPRFLQSATSWPIKKVTGGW